MKSCLDCLHCKIREKRLICKKNQWAILTATSIPEVLYSERNIGLAQIGNSRYLNQNQKCHYFFDMED